MAPNIMYSRYSMVQYNPILHAPLKWWKEYLLEIFWFKTKQNKRHAHTPNYVRGYSGLIGELFDILYESIMGYPLVTDWFLLRRPSFKQTVELLVISDVTIMFLSFLKNVDCIFELTFSLNLYILNCNVTFITMVWRIPLCQELKETQKYVNAKQCVLQAMKKYHINSIGSGIRIWYNQMYDYFVCTQTISKVFVYGLLTLQHRLRHT